MLDTMIRDEFGRFEKGSEGFLHKHTEKTKKKMSKNYVYHVGPTCFKKGSKGFIGNHSEKTKERIRIKLLGRKNPEHSEKMKGRKYPEHSEKMKGRFLGKKNPNWQGGKSFELYGLDFNKTLKEQIRERDNYQCQECNVFQKDLGYKLPIHHIDYNKKNNDPYNLISLCRSCHTKSGFGRKDWIIYYQEKLRKGKYNAH